MKSLPLLIAGLAFFASGCTSVKSTLINRTESDIFIGNSNGKPKAKCAARPFNGVPITLRVPTHVDVVIKEKILLRSKGIHDLTRVATTKRHLFVETRVIETDKVFTVDIKRPGAGTLNYGMTFGEGKNAQYFAELSSEIEDNTLQDITEAIGTITQAVTTSQTGGNDPKAAMRPTFFPETRTVAWRRFDIDSPAFEQQVAEFVSQHMNQCNSCALYEASNTFETKPGDDVSLMPNVDVDVDVDVDVLRAPAPQQGFRAQNSRDVNPDTDTSSFIE